MGILVCLLENAFATLFSLNNTEDEHAVYTADQLSLIYSYNPGKNDCGHRVRQTKIDVFLQN
jgi:hypothetical protein